MGKRSQHQGTKPARKIGVAKPKLVMDGGYHVILDIMTGKTKAQKKWLIDETLVIGTLEAAIAICGAVILDQHWRRFSGDGYTGMYLLAESHLSIHTFPEVNYAAIDIFMCGRCDPVRAVNKIIADLPHIRAGYSKIPRNSNFFANVKLPLPAPAHLYA